MRQEESDNGFNDGFNDGSLKMALKTARKLLLDGFSESTVSYFTELSINDVKELKIKLNRE